MSIHSGDILRYDGPDTRGAALIKNGEYAVCIGFVHGKGAIGLLGDTLNEILAVTYVDNLISDMDVDSHILNTYFSVVARVTGGEVVKLEL